MKTILITTSSFDVSDQSLIPQMEKSGFQVVLNPFARKLTEDEVLGLIEQHQPTGMIAGVEPLTAKVLESGVNLKVVSRCGIGLDSVNGNIE